MKFLAWISGILVTILVVVSVVAFTPMGNSLLQPIIEGKIKEQTKLDSKLNVFALSMSDFEIVLELNSKNIITVKGDYSLFSQSFDISYEVKLSELKTLKPLTGADLRESLYTDGTIKGDMAFIELDGVSDVASSDTSYRVELTDLNPTSIIAKIDGADLSSLLYMGGQSRYANADIDLDVNFKNVTPHKLDGDILLQTKDGIVDRKLMKRDFNITLPKTAFSINLDAKLKGDDIDYSYLLSSNLAKISSSGIVTPSPLKTVIKYGVDIKELALLKPITNAPLRGAFMTKGTVKGSELSMLVEGISDIGASNTTYKIDLKEFKPQSVIATIKGAKVHKLLYMVGQPNLASANLDVDVKLTSLDPKNLAGYMDIKMKRGWINSKVMRKNYKVKIPKTTFNSNTNIKLNGKDVDYKMAFNSNLAKLSSSGHLVPDTMAMNLKYGINIKELALLKPITGADVRGAFNLGGKVKGDKKRLIVDGKSNFASSKTSFVATLKDFEPSSIKADIKNLKLAKVLYMVKQPHYADGVFFLNADISDARSGKLKGVVTTTIKKGLLDSRYMTKAYKFETKMPRTTFKLSTNTKLNGDIVDTKIDLDSTLANFDIKKARMNLKDGSLLSDYRVKVPSLDKLYFVTQRHMKGGISADGELKKGKNLDLTMHSKVAGGKMDLKLYNDDLHADIVAMQTLDILHILIYPEIFKAFLNAKVDYNLARERGLFKGHLVDGTFTKNEMFGLVKRYAKIDLYREKFKGDVNAKINKEHIIAGVDLKSRTASIITKGAKLNSKTKALNAKIDIVANKHPLSIKITGTTDKPKYGVDAQELIETQVKDVILEDLAKDNSKIKHLFKKLF